MSSTQAASGAAGHRGGGEIAAGREDVPREGGGTGRAPGRRAAALAYGHAAPLREQARRPDAARRPDTLGVRALDTACSTCAALDLHCTYYNLLWYCTLTRQHLPPHSVSVFIPLCPLTELNGAELSSATAPRPGRLRLASLAHGGATHTGRAAHGQGAWGCGVAERPGQGLLRGLPRPGALTELNGPTEFQLSTHIKANLTRPPKHADARCPLGSLAIYDIRVMHRGGAQLGRKQGGSDLCQLALRRLLSPHITPRAAPSSGHPRPVGRCGPHRPGHAACGP